MAYERSSNLAFLKKGVDPAKKVSDNLVIIYEDDGESLLTGIFK